MRWSALIAVVCVLVAATATTAEDAHGRAIRKKVGVRKKKIKTSRRTDGDQDLLGKLIEELPLQSVVNEAKTELNLPVILREASAEEKTAKGLEDDYEEEEISVSSFNARSGSDGDNVAVPSDPVNVSTTYQVAEDSKEARAFPYDGVASLKAKIDAGSSNASSADAPYSSLPQKYSGQPTSYYALNTFVEDDKDEKEAEEEEIEYEEEYEEEEEKSSGEQNKDEVKRASIDHDDVKNTSTLSTPLSTSTTTTTTTTTATATTSTTKAPKKSSKKSKVVSKKDSSEEAATFKPSTQEGFIPSRQDTSYGGGRSHSNEVVSPSYSNGESRLDSTPTRSSFGVSVDFAGHLSDNPLYIGSQDDLKHKKPKKKHTQETAPHDAHPKLVTSQESPLAVVRSPPNAYATSFQPSGSVVKPSSSLKAGLPPQAVPRQTSPSSPPSHHGLPSITASTISSSGSPFSTPPSRPSAPPLSPPRFPPALTEVSSDLNNMMEDLITPINSFHQKHHQPFVDRVGHAMQKMMGGFLGDNSFDFYDFVPIIVVAVGAAILLSALFPNGLTNIGLNGGNVVLNGRKDDDAASDVERVLNQIESGMMMLGALRREEGCSQLLACRLGDVARERLGLDLLDADNGAVHVLADAVGHVLPDRVFGNFSRSLLMSLSDSTRSGCQLKCSRCLDV